MSSFKEIAKKSPNELIKELSEKREALRVFRFGISGSKVKNMKEGKNIKKYVARILTVMNQNENK